MGILILPFVLLSFARIQKACGVFSWTFAGCASFFVYSLPAIIGLKRHFYYSGQRHLATADTESTLVVLTAWAFFTISLFSLPLQYSRRVSAISREPRNYFPELVAALVLSLMGILYLMYEGGVTFFLRPRNEQVYNYLTLIWRWCIVIGFTASLLVGRRWVTFLFLFLLALIFIQGDRTVFAIAAAIYLLFAMGRGLSGQRPSAILRNPKYLLAIVAIFMAVLLGKPIYLSVKELSFDPLLAFLEVQSLESIALSAEPFVTFTHVDAVTQMNIRISLRDFFTSVLGNLLVIPSAFGVETNLYNETVTARLPSMVRYGVAGNYWAHAMTVGGLIAVALFACAYAGALALLDRSYMNSEGRVRLGLTVIASATAVYLHRNGLDNFLSFVRQILLAWLAVYFVSLFSKPADHSSKVGARRHA